MQLHGDQSSRVYNRNAFHDIQHSDPRYLGLFAAEKNTTALGPRNSQKKVVRHWCLYRVIRANGFIQIDRIKFCVINYDQQNPTRVKSCFQPDHASKCQRFCSLSSKKQTAHREEKPIRSRREHLCVCCCTFLIAIVLYENHLTRWLLVFEFQKLICLQFDPQSTSLPIEKLYR